MTTTVTPAQDLEVPIRPRSPQAFLWGAIGLLSVIVVARGWIGWITSDDFHAAPTGPDQLGSTRHAIVVAAQFVSCVAAAAMIYRYVVQPLRRTRRLGFDGKLLFAAVLAWFYDPLFNYFGYSQAYNAAFVNFSSWVNFIPGWSFPSDQPMVEPILFILPATVWGIFGSSIIGCEILERLRRRSPHASDLRLFLVLAAIFAVGDVLLETLLVRYLQLTAFPASPQLLTLFAGEPTQFPMLEAACIVPFFVTNTAIRWYRTGDRSVVERGVERIRNPAGRAVASFLAIAGALHFSLVVAYHVPWTLVSMHADAMPTLPSYFQTDGCGAGDPDACLITSAPAAPAAGPDPGRQPGIDED